MAFHVGQRVKAISKTVGAVSYDEFLKDIGDATGTIFGISCEDIICCLFPLKVSRREVDVWFLPSDLIPVDAESFEVEE